MASRRSNRGGGLRAAERATAQNRAEFEQAEEERKRFEAERDHTLRVGWEEWDSLDTDTRQDLLRHTLMGALSAVGGVATSPRKLGAQQGIKAALKRVAPGLAKRMFAGKPSKQTKSLMERINKVRSDRAAKQERIAKIEKDLASRRDPSGRAPTNRPAMSKKDAAEGGYGKPLENPFAGDYSTLAGMTALGATNPITMGNREALLRVRREKGLMDRMADLDIDMNELRGVHGSYRD